METVRSLLEDGLVRIGDLPYPGEKFTGWNLPIDAAMERVHDLFVAHHVEPALWGFRIWLGLTPAGEQLAQRLRNEAVDGDRWPCSTHAPEFEIYPRTAETNWVRGEASSTPSGTPRP